MVANVTIKRSKHVQDAETQITLQQIAFTSTKRAENVEKSVTWRVRVDLLEHRSPRQREAVRRAREASVQAQSKRVGIVARMGTYRPRVPRRRSMRWEILTTASQVGSQDTTMAGSIGSYSDLGSASEGIREPRGADEKICSMSAPNVR